jgi:hypothetical protein
MFTGKAFMLHFQCIILPKTCCGKNAEAAENGLICQLLSIFQRSVTHGSRAAQAAHQANTIKATPQCTISQRLTHIHNFVEIKSVP